MGTKLVGLPIGKIFMRTHAKNFELSLALDEHSTNVDHTTVPTMMSCIEGSNVLYFFGIMPDSSM